MNKKVSEAVAFATSAHKNQFRKTTGEPYIVHPISVMDIVSKYTTDTDIICAAVLHDTIEDTPTSAMDIEQNFGKKVKDLVVNESEPDKSWTWEQRKQATIDRLQNCNDMGCLLIACADKLDNARCFLREHGKIGDDVWNHFKRGYDKQKWYHTSLLGAFKKQMPDCKMVDEYESIVKELFDKD